MITTKCTIKNKDFDLPIEDVDKYMKRFSISSKEEFEQEISSLLDGDVNYEAIMQIINNIPSVETKDEERENLNYVINSSKRRGFIKENT